MTIGVMIPIRMAAPRNESTQERSGSVARPNVPRGGEGTSEMLRDLPKVELHVHLEGTFDAERIAELAADAGEKLPRPVADLFELADLDDFLGFLDWTCGLVRNREHAERVAYDFAARATRDGTRYVEVIVNPTHWRAWRLGELIGSLAAGFDRAQSDGLADCRLLISLLREQSGDDALALVRWMADERPSRVVGLSVDGNEARSGRTGDRFAPAFHLARAEGFGAVAHAGESSGPEGVRDALDLLEVDRIDHGVRAAEDPALVARLARSGVPLDVCLTSNLTMLYARFEEHPIKLLLDAGVAVTLNTDDPAYLGVDLTDEFVLASTRLAWSLDDAIARVRTAIDASFCEADLVATLHGELDAFAASTGTDALRNGSSS
jgi:adenosine deaminase